MSYIPPFRRVGNRVTDSVGQDVCTCQDEDTAECVTDAMNRPEEDEGPDPADLAEAERRRRNRQDSPGLVRRGADRDREMSYEDYRELTREADPPDHGWMNNEDI